MSNTGVESSQASDVITLSSWQHRSAVENFFAQRHGGLTNEGWKSTYSTPDGQTLLVTFANKNRKTRTAWLNVNLEVMERLDHPSGFFAFAFFDWDERTGYFFEVPMGQIAQGVREQKLKLFGKRYSLYANRRGGRFQLRNIGLDIQEYLVGQASLRWVSEPKDDSDKESEPEPEYSAEQFLAETYLNRETFEELYALLEDKRQIILYGPPGTGKTYVAQKFARHFVGGDESRVQIIQFHPSYSYEEFMEGIRPEARDDGPPAYPVCPGVFRAFCEEARAEEGRFVMIIDEINRGNIAKIFGELMFLLEYRNCEVPLPYSGVPFSIPGNVYLVGTMNTADRSIALVDFALRRRFHFVHFGADRDVLARWIQADDAQVSYLLDLFDQVNRAIDDRDYQIGFSYFMKPGMTETDLRRVWRYSIEPYLEEYFFDNRAKVEELRWDALMSHLRGGE